MDRKVLSRNELEKLLLDATESVQAGVFRKTSINSSSIFAAANAVSTRENEGESSNSARRGWFSVARVATPIAACLLIWVGVRTTDFDSNVTQPAVPQAMVAVHGGLLGETGSADRGLALFNSCFTGPGADLLSGDCSDADLDRDGDVDFADFGRFQRQIVSKNG
jgi:hypothetical protein